MTAPVIARWIDALNARDLPAILACLDPEIEFHPLKLHGIADVYRGRLGVRRWLAQVAEHGHEHVLVVARVEWTPERTALAAGSMTFPGSAAAAPFAGVYELRDGLIRHARHYMSEPETLFRLGTVATAV